MQQAKSDGEQQRRENRKDRDIPYTYAASGHIADSLERTQIHKFGTKGGTGFAAEDANALHERLRGVKVDQVGTNNAKNGADRIADGVSIQTKYFDSAASTVRDAFDKSGKYRYGDMKLEVPSDQYDDAIRLMKAKIANNNVPGMSNPEDATNLIKKGEFTYRQARNIARAGNIDSLTYDVKNNAVTGGVAFGISFAISYWRNKRNGLSTKDALKACAQDGLLAAGLTFVAGVSTSQLLRTQTARAGTVFVRSGVKAIAKTKAGKVMVQKLASASAGKNLSGAAATNHLSKVMRTNAITATVTTVVITAPDMYRAGVSKNTSWAQVGKNFVVNGVSVAAGTGGWMGGAAAGAAAGTAVLPGLGTALGAVAGGLVGSIAAGAGGSYFGKKLMDYVITDDAEEMLFILNAEMADLSEEYLLDDQELNALFTLLNEVCDETFLRDMFAQEARQAFVRSRFEPKCREIMTKRAQMILPVQEKVQAMLDEIMENLEAAAKEEETKSYRPNFVLVGGMAHLCLSEAGSA
jgi:hypothetical protein